MARKDAGAVSWLGDGLPLAAAAAGMVGIWTWPALAPAIIPVAILAVAALLWQRTTDSAAEARPGAGIDQRSGDPVSGIRLADAVPEPLILFDAGGAVVHANVAAVAAFGDLPAGLSLPLRFRAPEMQTLIEGVLAGSAPASTDHAERLPVDRFYHVTATPIGDRGRLFLLAFDDHSEARRIDTMRADFIANASHELRTPLASIAGFVETLRGPARGDAAARERFLGIIQEQTARMSRLIDDLLSLSRLEMRPLPYPAAALDLAAIVASVADTLKPLADESGVVIEREFDRGPFLVEGNPDELFQVFENLVENACKYGQSGGRIVLTIRRRGESEVESTVRDFGPGIAEEHIPRVTERFYRVDVENSRAQKGTGLGLSIVKHILTRHRGRLTIRSAPGQGATFTVQLPAAAPPQGLPENP